jgi:non-heme chloroperoxidase
MNQFRFDRRFLWAVVLAVVVAVFVPMQSNWAHLMVKKQLNQTQAAPNQISATTPDGVRIDIQEWGTPSGRELILVHGLLGSHLSWDKQVHDPKLQKYRIITYDLRGHGLSGMPTKPAFYSNGKRWADELKTAIDAKRLQHPVVIGWSLGGFILTNYLRIYGDRNLGGIVYVDGVIDPNPKLQKGRTESARLMNSTDLSQHLEGTRQFLQRCFYRLPDSATFEKLFAIAAMGSPVMTRTVNTSISVVSSPFPTVQVPALLILGEQDSFLRRAMLDRQQQLIPNAETSLYAAIGHSPFLESSERFNREIDRFMAKTANARRSPSRIGA